MSDTAYNFAEKAAITARLLGEFTTPVKVAEALLEGRLNSQDQLDAHVVVNPIILETARIRLEWKQKEIAEFAHTVG